MIIKNIINCIKAQILYRVWEYGICKNQYARRNKFNKNVQFIIFKKGDQKYIDGIGHKKDKWINFDSSWWDKFIPTK